jgi:hypothetical protein
MESSIGSTRATAAESGSMSLDEQFSTLSLTTITATDRAAAASEGSVASMDILDVQAAMIDANLGLSLPNVVEALGASDVNGCSIRKPTHAALGNAPVSVAASTMLSVGSNGSSESGQAFLLLLDEALQSGDEAIIQAMLDRASTASLDNDLRDTSTEDSRSSLVDDQTHGKAPSKGSNLGPQPNSQHGEHAPCCWSGRIADAIGGPSTVPRMERRHLSILDRQ